MKVYVTPEEYERAAEIGVSERTVYNRIKTLHWDKEKAITTPIFDRSRGSKKALAESNGISEYAYYYRINVKGWSKEKAATTPPMSTQEVSKVAIKARDKNICKYTKLAKKNNIPMSVYNQRVYTHKWTKQRAATEPVRRRRK